MLSSERDIEDYLYNQRVLRLLKKTVLSHRQQATVPYFSRYIIRDKKLRDKGASSADTGVNEYTDIELWDGLDPENSMTDRLILYEIARRRHPASEADQNFSATEESSEGDYEEDELLDTKVTKVAAEDSSPSTPTSSSALLERSEYNLNASYKSPKTLDHKFIDDD